MPNKRLKLAGGDRLKGSGVLCAGTHKLSFKLHGAQRASRPQLKREPLGSPSDDLIEEPPARYRPSSGPSYILRVPRLRDAAPTRRYPGCFSFDAHPACGQDRKSTRLNSSHGYISYAVFCLKKKKKKNTANTTTTL